VTWAAIAVAVLALLVALAARSKASKLATGIEDAKTDARRRVENAREETREEVETLRRILARVAGGEKLAPEMVLEGRLWREASQDEGKAMVAAGDVRVLDVRTPQETARGILPGAVLIPVQTLEERWQEVPKDGRRTLVYCAGGERSAAACEFLSRQGYENLYNLVGGFLSWSGPTAKA
jgi:rhodanese-related sulfurtransferase